MLKHDVDVIILAGYMKKLGMKTLSRFEGRVLNIHPALLPKFGGKGMYGMNVHEAVIAAGEKESGVSIHIVDADYDTGPVIAQARVPVEPTDTAEILAARVLRQEHKFFPETLQNIVDGKITLHAKNRQESEQYTCISSKFYRDCLAVISVSERAPCRKDGIS